MALEVLSLGVGVQSSTVFHMSCLGVLPKLDAAIFADPGWESRGTYWYFDYLQGLGLKAGIPIYRVQAGNIRAAALRSHVRSADYKQTEGGRWASMPMYTRDAQTGQLGQIKRQCTREYKIEPIQRQVALLLKEAGLSKTPGVVRQWMGISGDEMRRMRVSKVRYIEHWYPLVFAFDRPMHRTDCLRWLQAHDLPIPPRSACLGCPYKSNEEWRAVQQDQEAWADVVELDEAIRHREGMRGQTYLHRSCQPLKDVDLRSEEEKGQLNWLNECEGMCGV